MKRISPYIREKTYQLLKDYCLMNEYDISRAVDEILYFRLDFMLKGKQEAINQLKKDYEKMTWEELQQEAMNHIYDKDRTILNKIREIMKKKESN